jgi:predicted transglutaminase-like cysteine proteinase
MSMTAPAGKHNYSAKHERMTHALALCAMVIAAAFAAAGDPGSSSSVTSGLMDYFARLFGQGARGRLEGWKEFVRNSAGRGSGDPELLRPVNGFFNDLPFVEDRVHWRIEDYWATPAEFLSSRGGDCEDYVIAKYFTLKELGVPVSRLRLVYARTWRTSEAHMVLAYFAAPGADPLILDNQERGIRRAADRPDLIPVYMFNDDDLQFVQKGADAPRHDAMSIRKWRGVMEKLARELTL